MFEYLSHNEAERLSRKLTMFKIRVQMARGLFLVSAAVAVLIWAIKL